MPEPAGAWTRMERAGSRAWSRWGWSGGGELGAVLLIGRLREIGAFGVVFGFGLGLIFLDTAEGLEAAALAGFGRVAGIDFGASGEEVSG